VWVAEDKAKYKLGYCPGKRIEWLYLMIGFAKIRRAAAVISNENIYFDIIKVFSLRIMRSYVVVCRSCRMFFAFASVKNCKKKHVHFATTLISIKYIT